MKLISVNDLAKLVKKHGFDRFMLDLVNYIKQDFANWQDFTKSARYAAHVPGGVLELMPTANKQYFTYKAVNGHPSNPFDGKQTVVATGALHEIKYGYPLLISEMTTLTGFRTAATSLIATEYLARHDSTTLTIIGTGAQSEFQVLAHKLIRPINTVRYYDIDPLAMDKFEQNMVNSGLQLVRCASAKEACLGADIIIVCTACKLHVVVIEDEWVKNGVHINALGGDCPGKTELDKKILFRSKVVVEYTEQSFIEGEIQQLTEAEVKDRLYAELWELITNKKLGRVSDEEITVFDSVGFAVEDFSALRLTLDLANQYGLGSEVDITPQIKDPKNLFSVVA